MKETAIHFIPSRPGIADFQICAVWCPYQYPWELDDLKQWGADSDDIDNHVLNVVRKGHFHPHYSIPDGRPVGQRDLIFAAVDLRLPVCEKSAFGYLVFSDGEPTSLYIFDQHEEFAFYRYPAEPDENREEMLRMTGDQVMENLAVTIRPRLSPPDLIIPAVFNIPITPRG